MAGTTGELLPGIESVPSREAFSLRFFGKDGRIGETTKAP